MTQKDLEARSNTSAAPASSRRRWSWRWLGFVAALIALGLGLWGVMPQVEAKRYWDLAKKAQADDDVQGAADHFKKCAARRAQAALRFWPFTAWLGDAELHFALAQAARQVQDYDEARTQLERAEQAGWPGDAVALEYVLLEAEVGDLTTVERTLRNNLRVGHHEEERILEALIRGYLNEQRLAEADHQAREWQARYPDAWRPHYYQGQAAELIPRLDQAAAAYQRVLERKADHLDATFRLGDVKRRMDQYHDALPYLERAHVREPGNAVMLASLLRCLRALGQTKAAYDLVSSWLESRGAKQPEIVQLKARLAYDNQRPDEAFEWYQRAEKLAPNDEEIMRGLEALHRERGDADEAERYKRRADDAYANMLRVERLVQRIRDDLNNPQPRLDAGQLLLTMGHVRPGLRYLKSILEIDAAHPGAHLALADYYQSQGDLTTAANHRLAAEGKLKASVGK